MLRAINQTTRKEERGGERLSRRHVVTLNDSLGSSGSLLAPIRLGSSVAQQALDGPWEHHALT